MNEVVCPSCKKAFKIDDTAFADILKQIRNREFDAELHARIESEVKLAVAETKNEVKADVAKKEAEIIELKSAKESEISNLQTKLEAAIADKENAAELAKSSTKNELQEDIAKRDAEIAKLKAENTTLQAKTEAEKEAEISKLQAKIESTGADKDAQIARLLAELEAAETEKESAVKLAEANTKNGLQADVAKKETELVELKAENDSLLTKIQSEKDAEIARLKSQLDAAESDKKLAVNEITTKIEKERDELRGKLELAATEKELAVSNAVNIVEKQRDELASNLEVKDREQKILESSLKEKYETELKSKDEMIAYYKDMKARLSTKMVGETLEQHCEIEFEKLRATGFKNAQFGKDNDASSGSKGDYIYRETDDDGNEIISIMFDMKNESDETATKKKNEDFLKELDKDRAEKNCEYAVLVTLLEADHELYNSGIVDVSHRHDKMYVVRPQFFIPIITVLRNAALNSMRYKSELALIRSQNVDITNFESDLQQFQDGFMKNVKDSSHKFQEAMDGIDATIRKLEGVKEALRLSNKHLLTAGGKVENVSLKRLTKNNPTMAAKFSELNNNETSD